MSTTRFANKKAGDHCEDAHPHDERGSVMGATSSGSSAHAKRVSEGFAVDADTVPRVITQCGKLAAGEDELPGARCVSEYSYLNEVSRLDPGTRGLALQRANELIAHGHKEQRALRMAVNLARLHTDIRIYGDNSLPEPALHLLCEYDAWLLLCEDQGEPTHGFDWFRDAILQAHEITSETGLALYVYDTDGVIFAKYESSAAAFEPRDMIHILAHEIGWALKGFGETEPFKLFDTLKQAEDHARRAMRDESATLVVHYRRDNAYPPISYQ